MISMKKKLPIILGLVAIFLGTVLLFRIFSPKDMWLCVNDEWVKQGTPLSSQPETGCGDDARVGINFNETGHLVINNPGLTPGVWYLIYEKPGAPALYKQLSFEEGSICSFNGNKGTCPDVLLPSSALTNVQGLEKEGIVHVVSATSGN